MKKQKVCTIQMNGELLEKLNNYTEKHERSKSFVLRKALEIFLNDKEAAQ